LGWQSLRFVMVLVLIGSTILNECVLAGIIQKSGSWFSYGDTKLGQGEDSVSDLLRDNPELFEELKANLTSD